MTARSIANSVFPILAALFVASCNTTPNMDIPSFKADDLLQVNKPLNDQASFALTKVVANIKRGTTIANFPAAGVAGVDSGMCNYKRPSDTNLEWGGGSSVLGNWSTELGEIFYEVLTQKGLRIAGDPKDLFGQKKSVGSAEYLIGARISKINGNFCQDYSWWNGRLLDRYSGEFYVKVEWIIFSGLFKREVLRLDTEGYFKQKQSKKDGIEIAFREAFARAAENLMSSKELIKLATRAQSADDKVAAGPKLYFRGARERRSSFKDDLDLILPAVVTIRPGSGHGSGFIISEDGLILTNSHVVGEATNVSVILNNGLEVPGQVLRVDRKRDVALIKVALRVRNSLPVRLTEIRQLEKVFAIGTPLLEDLRSTVTSGIVSAFRKNGRTGLSFIQSDVAISPGNSGGPLLDGNGNVIGISVLKIVGTNSESLNLFIPIGSALRALNLQQKRPDNPLAKKARAP